jgi:hypothetical protein
LPTAVATYLATLSGPEQHGTHRAYRSTLRALLTEFSPSRTDGAMTKETNAFTVAELDDEANVHRLTE